MEQEHQIEVVLFGIPDAGYPWNLEEGATVPYDERSKTSMVVSEDDTLAELVNRAGRKLDVPLPKDEWVPPYDGLSDLLSYFSLYRRGEELGIPSYTRTLPTVDREGNVRFAVPWTDVRYGDLLRAKDAGLIDGDVARPYVFLPTAFGDFPGFGWSDVIAALDVIWSATEYADTALGAIGGGSWVIDRLNRLRRRTRARSDLLKKHASNWSDRGAAPADFDELLSLRAWKAEEAARVLGCTRDEAEAILWALGCSYNHADDRWYRDRTTEDAVIHGDLTIAIWAQRSPGEHDELHDDVADRLKKYLGSGQIPPFPWDQPT